MKCIYLLVITIPFSLCIIIKTENNKVIGQSKSVEPRASAIQDDDKKDLQAEPSIEHSHYDYPGKLILRIFAKFEFRMHSRRQTPQEEGGVGVLKIEGGGILSTRCENKHNLRRALRRHELQ